METWSAPRLDSEILNAYKPKASSSGYSINDHPNLTSGTIRPVFEAFRREVLALDPCVIEEFTKTYAAYKAETNFVDAIPQSKRLRLILNMLFSDINDPKNLCKDVSHLGHLGNGEVEVSLSYLAELPYVMGLVRQSFELQMGNTGDGD